LGGKAGKTEPALPSFPLENILQKIRQLLLPPGPIVVDILSPVVEPGGDAFVAQDLFEGARFGLQPVFVVRFETIDLAIVVGEIFHYP